LLAINRFFVNRDFVSYNLPSGSMGLWEYKNIGIHKYGNIGVWKGVYTKTGKNPSEELALSP